MIDLLTHSDSYGEVFNIGHTEEISIHDLAILVKNIVGSTSEIVFIPFEEAYEPGFEDMPRRLPDLSKIQRYIGYQPSRGLETMLRGIVSIERERPVKEETTRAARSVYEKVSGRSDRNGRLKATQ